MTFSSQVHLIAILLLLNVSIGVGQANPTLEPNRPTSFDLKADEEKLFSLVMKANDYADFDWLTRDSGFVEIKFSEMSGHTLERGSIFVAPRDGTFQVSIRLRNSEHSPVPIGQSQRITIEYKDRLNLPTGSKLQDAKTVAQYDIRIFETPDTDNEGPLSIVVFKKGGLIKRVFKDAATRGFSFSDPYWSSSPAQRKKLVPVENYLDKTGDGIPDIVIAYSTHVDFDCCWTTYVVNLGDTADVIAEMDQGMRNVLGNPKGGIRFRVRETAFDGWNGSYSPLDSCDSGDLAPVEVILEFRGGKPHPNFELLRKTAPSLSALGRKARLASAEIDLKPYSGSANSEGECAKRPFWIEMLNLIYTGHEKLGWEYFDLVWPASKPGKDVFLKDFKDKLLKESYYGRR